MPPELRDFKLFGTNFASSDYNAIDVALYPCASRIEAYDGSILGADDSCVWDQGEVEDYLGAVFWIKAYSNQQVFRKHEYGDERIIDQARMYKVWTWFE